MLDSAKTRFPEPLDSSYSTITGITSSSASSTVTSASKKKNITDDISKVVFNCTCTSRQDMF